MNPRLRSALIAGVSAAVIWAVIAALTGGSLGFVLGWAVVFLVGVTAVTWLISTVIHSLVVRNRGGGDHAGTA